jgi:hypothetical protein
MQRSGTRFLTEPGFALPVLAKGQQFARSAECRFQDPPNDDLVSGPVHPAAEESSNVKYLCLVYEEEAKVDALSAHDSAAISDENLDYLAELEASGHYLASARLQPAETAATIRVHNGTVFISGAPVVGAKERLGGFQLIDARDLNDAIRIAAKMPRARLGWIEVRPLEECDAG